MCRARERKNEKRELISDMWGKRGAAYGEKGVCRRIKMEPVVLHEDLCVCSHLPIVPPTHVILSHSSYVSPSFLCAGGDQAALATRALVELERSRAAAEAGSI